MSQKVLDLAKFGAVFAFGLWLLIVSALYFLQEQFIFPALDIPPAAVSSPHFQPVNIATPDGEKLYGLHHPSLPGEATVLVFHGNGDLAGNQISKGNALVEAEFGVLLLEYRGYPGSSGTPTEAGLRIDAKAAYDFVVGQREQKIGLFAHSLGTGVAVRLASERKVDGMVLLSPFDSLLAVVQGSMPWAPSGLLLKHPFRSDLVIGDLKMPLLIMHGTQDQVVPIEHGRRLHGLAHADAQFATIVDGKHNNLGSFGTTEKAVEFLKQSLR